MNAKVKQFPQGDACKELHASVHATSPDVNLILGNNPASTSATEQ
jgi:hypothetical protein